ncbi:MAG: sulfite exporter TauE/SafE family protein [Desulfobaccales bacterium]
MAPHETTLAYLSLISLGFIISAYGTIVGAAGGFLYVPILLMLYPKEHHSILTAIALAVNFFTAFSGLTSYIRQKRIDYKSGWLFAAATIPGAILGVITTTLVQRRHFEGIFSVFLIGLALFMFFRPKSDTPATGEGQPAASRGGTYVTKTMDGITFEYHYNRTLGLVVFFFLGFVASFLGIGGGALIMPTLSYVVNFPVFIATGTSIFIVTIITSSATVANIFHGAFHHGAHRIAALSMGALVGAQVGGYLSDKVKGPWVIRALAIAIAAAAVKMFLDVL